MRKSLKKKPTTLYVLNGETKFPRTVYQLRKKYDGVPLSYLYGIEDEIDFQCPIIDDYIDKIQECKNILAKAKRAKRLETKDGHIMKALHILHNIDTELDEVTRGNFIKLRDYADSWKKLAIRLLNASRNPEKYMPKK